MPLLKTSLAIIGSAVAVVYGAGAALHVVDSNQTRVYRAIDGDTLDITQGDTIFRVRLLSIYVPELSHDCKPAKCLAETAKSI